MTRPIRVLELRSVYGTGGGPDKTILLGAAQIDRSRFEVTVCYIRDDRDHVCAIDRRATELALDYVEIRERHSWDRSVWPRLRALVRERGIDIVHAHEHKTDLLALLLARTEGIIPMATAHGWSGLSLRERGYYVVDRRILARYPAVIAVSRQIRRTLLACGAWRDRVHTILNGIDADLFRRDVGMRERARAALDIPPDARVIGAIGRLEPIKRYDVLLDALCRIIGEPRPLLLMAGDGPQRARLAARSRVLGLERQVRWLGHVGDVRGTLAACDVFVQSSDSEGVPNAVLEAMALEVPVVATRVGGTEDLARDDTHALLVARRDPDQLARAIARTFADPASTARRVIAARARVERDLSFSTRMRRVEALYETLVPRQRLAPMATLAAIRT